jgi:hypothetical protein
VRRFRCAHCAVCVKPFCCNCRRKRSGRLPHRRYERSGAAAVMALVRDWALSLCWKLFFRRTEPSLSQPLSLGGLLSDRTRRSGFDVARPQNADSVRSELAPPQKGECNREVTRRSEAAHMPRRVSSALAGSGRA